MSNKVKDLSIKNHTYYFFHDIIDINNFDTNNIKIDEKSCKIILIYHIGYMTIKDLKYVKLIVKIVYTLSTKWMNTLNKFKKK